MLREPGEPSRTPSPFVLHPERRRQAQTGAGNTLSAEHRREGTEWAAPGNLEVGLHLGDASLLKKKAGAPFPCPFIKQSKSPVLIGTWLCAGPLALAISLSSPNIQQGNIVFPTNDCTEPVLCNLFELTYMSERKDGEESICAAQKKLTAIKEEATLTNNVNFCASVTGRQVASDFCGLISSRTCYC